MARVFFRLFDVHVGVESPNLILYLKHNRRLGEVCTPTSPLVDQVYILVAESTQQQMQRSINILLPLLALDLISFVCRRHRSSS
jgi:hypothetical protein